MQVRDEPAVRTGIRRCAGPGAAVLLRGPGLRLVHHISFGDTMLLADEAGTLITALGSRR